MREIVENSGNIFEDQGNMEHDFWERENLVKVNFGEHLNLFLRNKSANVNFYREQGNMHPPPPSPGRPSSVDGIIIWLLI